MSDKKVKNLPQSTELAVSISDALERRRNFLRLAAGAGTAIGVGGLLAACGGGGDDGLVRETPKEETDPVAVGCTPKVVTLWAGQTNDWGTLTIYNDDNNLYVTYALSADAPADACLDELHLWVGDDLANLPSAPGNGAPIPGQFPFSYTPQECLRTYTFTIAKEDILDSLPSTLCGKKFYVVAHAASGGETIFGGDKPVNVKFPGRWWWYTDYTWCCLVPGPDDDMECQTAFAKGTGSDDTYVFTTDPKSNPEGLKSLKLIRNRWGWAINLPEPTTATGALSYDIWAGAGLNNTANGVKVGTLAVEWTGTTATVNYELFGDNCLQEVHLYVGDDKPTTTAPGQYGITAYYLDGCTKSAEFAVDVSDSGGDGIWLIAHAVVCYPIAIAT